MKSPKNLFILAMLGHISLISGSFMFSVLCYNEAIKIAPEHPLLLLCLGISLLHRAMQRVSENRQLETIQGISFLFKYLSVRKKSNNVEFEMEANYNIGRAYALLGLNHLAIMHFEKVLSLKDSLEDKKAQDVSMEAAYNLVILLNESGSFIKSREILQKYIVI